MVSVVVIEVPPTQKSINVFKFFQAVVVIVSDYARYLKSEIEIKKLLWRSKL